MENRARFISDNQGIISILAPDLNGRKVRFLFQGHGYSIDKTDFWGQKSVTCLIKPGKTFKLKIKRKQLAQRLYRITGAGRYNNSILAGLTQRIPTRNLLPGKVIGQDSLIAIPWNNELWCFYGDTIGLNSYNFSASCATLPLKSNRYDPEKFLPLKYKVDEYGFARPMIKTGKKGFTWIEYVLPVKIDSIKSQSEALLAKYVQHETLNKVAESGFAIMTRSSKNFKIIKKLNANKHHRCIHPYPVKTASQSFFLLSPKRMVSPGLKNIINQQKHFYFSPATENSSQEFSVLKKKKYRLNRNKEQKLVYKWQQGAWHFDSKGKKQLFAPKIMPAEALFSPIDLDSGKRIIKFTGSIVYNQYLKTWIAINQGLEPGQITFSTSDTPTGPWTFARTITEFSNYNLYNPIIHPWFEIDQGRSILFEGTYTWFFSSSEKKTPWADYNQMMFKLDLTQPELQMPKPVYRLPSNTETGELAMAEQLYEKESWNKVEDIAFFAFSECKNKDLVNLANLKGDGFKFHVLKTNPVTSWGKSWLKPQLAKYLRYLAFNNENPDVFALFKKKPAENKYKTVGIVLYIKNIARTWSPQIKAGSWNDWRKQ
jgi:hypothetical protein